MVTMMGVQEILPSELVRWNELYLRKHRNAMYFLQTLLYVPRFISAKIRKQIQVYTIVLAYPKIQWDVTRHYGKRVPHGQIYSGITGLKTLQCCLFLTAGLLRAVSHAYVYYEYPNKRHRIQHFPTLFDQEPFTFFPSDYFIELIFQEKCIGM